MPATIPDYALPLLRTWLLAVRPNSSLCCDAIGNVKQTVTVENGTTMCIKISCGQLSVQWKFPVVKSSNRTTVAMAITKLVEFKHKGEKCSADVAFAHIMRQALQTAEPLGVSLSSSNPGLVVGVDPNATGKLNWKLKPHTRIVRINGADVSSLSSAEIATILTQHPRPHRVDAVPVKPQKWVIPSSDQSPPVTLYVHSPQPDAAHSDEILRALESVEPSGLLHHVDGSQLAPDGSWWSKAMLCFRRTPPEVTCGSC